MCLLCSAITLCIITMCFIIILWKCVCYYPICTLFYTKSCLLYLQIFGLRIKVQLSDSAQGTPTRHPKRTSNSNTNVIYLQSNSVLDYLLTLVSSIKLFMNCRVKVVWLQQIILMKLTASLCCLLLLNLIAALQGTVKIGCRYRLLGTSLHLV